MNKEDYSKYYIQGSDHYLIPKDIFKELFNEMINWKEESKGLNQKYLNAVADYETTMSELQKLKKENKILRENSEHNDKVVDKVNWENQELKKQLEYLRSGEYYNQLRFENEMLQQVVDTNGVPSEVYDYIDCTHRNTELLEENQKYKEAIDKVIEYIQKMFETGFYNDDYYLCKLKKILQDKEV